MTDTIDRVAQAIAVAAGHDDAFMPYVGHEFEFTGTYDVDAGCAQCGEPALLHYDNAGERQYYRALAMAAIRVLRGPHE